MRGVGVGVTTVYITRHGETVWNVERRLQGWADSPLTERGVRQAHWLREALRQVTVDAVYSSSTARAMATAKILAAGRGLGVVPCDDLRELGMGDWEGRLTDDIKARWPAQLAAFWEAPHRYQPTNGGESYPDMQRRVSGALDQIVARHEGQTVLIVTHAAALKAMLACIEGRPLERLWDPPFIHPTALCRVVVADGTRAIDLHGDISHFQEDAGDD